jgi:hypothetical protein
MKEKDLARNNFYKFKLNVMKKLIYTLVILAFAVSLNAQWVQMSNGLGTAENIKSLGVNSSWIFAGLSTGLVRSSNNGNLWVGTNFPTFNANSIVTSGSNVFVSTSSNGIYRATDYGYTFTQVATNSIGGELCLAISGSYIFAGGVPNGVYFSTNNGNNWTLTSLTNLSIKCLAANGSNVFAGAMNTGVYFSSNYGTNWTQTSLNNKNIRSLAISGSNIFAGTDPNGVFVSTNNGNTWAQTSLNTGRTNAIVIKGNNIFAGNSEYGANIYQSTNNGITWTLINQGLSEGLNALLISNIYIFAGSAASSVWRRQLSELGIGIKNISSEIPSSYSLQQNYPNPFNPATNIKFAIPKNDFVKITVFDMLGKELETLVNEQLQPGTYETNWNASNYPSGIYFYKLSAGDYSETKKMLLLK